jgi:DNA repair photolyase
LESYKVVSRPRKGRILTPAQFGCLRGIPTLNITNGCLFHCTYCYARGYSQAPQEGEVELYLNLPALLEGELSRKRVPLESIILNTSSDCFQPHPDILDVTFSVLQTLLAHGVRVSFLTKGVIPGRFLTLFAETPHKIFAQIGLVSLSEQYRIRYEPGTPSIEERIENIRKMKAVGIFPEVRIDPIIPFVTDTESEMGRLLKVLREAGVRKVTLSYLHLRPAIHRQLMNELPPVHRHVIDSCFRTQGWKEIGSSTKTKLLPKPIREKGYQRIKKIAESFGIKALVCQCKNPDLQGDLCSSGRVKATSIGKIPEQLSLFQC